MELLKQMSKNILITGGAGFIGSNVTRHFVEKYPNYKIVVFDALTYAGNPDNLKDIIAKRDNFTFLAGDIKNSHALKKVFEDFKITDVIHLAAESHVDRSMVNPTEFVETNINGTVSLLNVARDAWKENFDGHIFLNMGTDEIFGALGVDDEPFNESTPLDPHSPYSTSKTAAVMFGKTYYEAYGLPVINLACGNAIGRNQYPEKLVPLVIDRLINGGDIPVYGKGEQMRDWTNVEDIADAIDLLIHKGTPGELYCIGGDACKQNIEIIERLILEVAKYYTEDKTSDFRKQVKFIKDPRGKSHDFRYDINHEKITNELGWVPKHTFEQSIEETVKWYFDNQEWVLDVKDGTYKRWIEEYYNEKENSKE